MPAPAIGVRPRWAPGPSAQIDWSHPLTSGMTFFVWAVGGRWVGTATPTMGSNALSGVSLFGSAVAAADNSSNSASFGINDSRFMPLSSSSGFTCAIAGFIPAPSAARALVSYENPVSGGSGWGMYSTATEVRAYAVQNSPRSYIDLSSVGGMGGLGTNDVFAFAYLPSDSRLQGWRGGRLTAQTALNSMFPTQGTNPLRIHGSSSNAASSAASLSCVAIWQRALTAADHAQFAADPFCFLRF